MTGKWTDGPWQVHVETEQLGIYRGQQSVFVTDARGSPDGQLARVNIQDGLNERAANARLIAAAPALYEALEKCQNVMALLTEPKHPEFASSAQHAWAQCVEAETAARLALRSARGEA